MTTTSSGPYCRISNSVCFRIWSSRPSHRQPQHNVVVEFDGQPWYKVTKQVDSGVARLWSQGGHRGFGDGSPPAGSRGGARVRVWGEAARSQIYTNNWQMSNVFLRRFVTESALHLPYSPTKNFGSVRIAWPNTAVAGWAPHVPIRAQPCLYATASGIIVHFTVIS